MNFSPSTVKKLWGFSQVIYKQGAFFTNGSVGLTVPEKDLPLVQGMILRAGKSVSDQEDIAIKEFPAGSPVDREELTRHFKMGATATKEDSRPVLKHVYITEKDMVSADGYWLAVSHVDSPVTVLASPLVGEFLRFTTGDLTVSLFTDNTENYKWAAGGWELVYRENPMTFPDYAAIFPKSASFSLWTKELISLAHNLPKLDAPQGTLKLGGFWVFHCKAAIAPKFVKAACDFVGEDSLQVGGGVKDKYPKFKDYAEWSRYGSNPIWFKGVQREALAMPMMVRGEGLEFNTPDPLVTDLVWKK